MIAGVQALAPQNPGQRDAQWLRRLCLETARLAVHSLYAELTLYPKPGLVSLVDNGSHDDMTAATFMRSMFALRHYFGRICRAGADDAPFSHLKPLGIEAERRMLAATGGINTHRGAIFSLGMLCAAVGRVHAQDIALTPESLRAILLTRWGDELATHSVPRQEESNGLRAAREHGASGAREEAALGLPSVFIVALPALRQAHEETGCWDRARIQALFALMAHVSDTNVYYRGGAAGAALVRMLARRFIARGGVGRIDWLRYALACHRIFTRRRLSPGGAADLLAAACLLHRLDAEAQAGGHG
jgi:triphosphoribosyl-dephospho-CoA synthase